MKKVYLYTLLAASAVACTDNEPINKDQDSSPAPDGKFVIAATVAGSNGSSNVLLASNSLDSGSVSAVGNGLLNDGASHWVTNKDKFLYALTYNQGNAGTTRSYILDSKGNITARDMEYKIKRFTTFGNVDNMIITTSTGDSPAAFADANGYLPKAILVSYLDVVNENFSTNSNEDGRYSAENYLGNGEFVTIAGIQQRGNQVICGIAPMGLSQYGAAADGGKWIRPGFEDLVKTADGGSNSSAYKKGELQWTQYPDECWVAIYNGTDFLNPTLAKTDRISYPAGRNKSAYYQTVWTDSHGDTYVFSPSYAKTMTDARQRTSLPAGVCRIPAGSNKFDSYYVNIEAQTGGKSFLRVWPAGDDKFVLVMYDRPLSETGFAATELAIFDASEQRVSYVTGLPQNISSFSGNPLVRNGKMYIPVNATGLLPAVYAVDLATATATRGLEVQATEITALNFLKP